MSIMSLESCVYSTHVNHNKMFHSPYCIESYGHAMVAQHTHVRTNHAWATKIICIILPYRIVGGRYGPYPHARPKYRSCHKEARVPTLLTKHGNALAATRRDKLTSFLLPGYRMSSNAACGDTLTSAHVRDRNLSHSTLS